MRQAMNKLKNLREQRAYFMRTRENAARMYPVDRNSLAGALDEISNQIYEDYLNRQIADAEEQAFDERAREMAEQMMKEKSNAGTLAGKQFAQAIQKGLNGKK